MRDPGLPDAVGTAGTIADPVAVRARLIDAARAGRALSYSEILGQLGHRFTRPRMRALCRTLEAVDRDCGARGEPDLAVLVVRESDRLPGQGWWVGGTAMARGYDGPWEGAAAQRFIADEQRQAFDWWRER